jgi:hypothetical protein
MRRLIAVGALMLAACSGAARAVPTVTTSAVAAHCADVFRPGIATQAGWTTAPVACDGLLVVSTLSKCPHGELVLNNYGHGYVDQPWSADTNAVCN